MRKTPDDITGNLEAGAILLPRFSYTLNNDQPVRCTLIGDQPLFYMDYEDDIEDDFDELFGIEAIEAGLQTIGRSFDLGNNIENNLVSDFISETHFITGQSDPAGKSFADIEALRFVLEQSRLGKTFFEFAEQWGIDLKFSTQFGNAFYDREAQSIFIHPSLGRDEQILLIARELRRAWQHKNGALMHPLAFHPDHAILVNRAQIADAQTMMVRVAWELQLAGEKGPWTLIENSSMADMGRAFAREAYLDFRTLNNGTAAAAAFESWFLSDRCRQEDKILIQNMLSGQSNYVFEDLQVSDRVSTDLIMALGSMPFGKNYLSPYVHMIVSDALFTEVRDRSNANFLWFIKFENSFNEAEQELQQGDIVQPSDDRQGAFKNKKQWIGDDEKESEIINLSDYGSPVSLESCSDGSDARIIPFPAHSVEG